MCLMMSIFAILLASVAADGTLDINKDACNVYTDKFGTANNEDGSGTTKLAFTGEVSIVEGTADAVVKLSYSDTQYYKNSSFFGLVTEDGQKPENTCLSLRLYRYTNEAYSDPVRITDLTIGNSQNEQKMWRSYLITFKGNELEQRLQRTESNNYYLYTGYYGVAYYLQGTEMVQYTRLFSFNIRINRITNQTVSTSFYPLSDKSRFNCSSNGAVECLVNPVSSLQFCSDSSCKAFNSTPNIHLNEQFWVLHKITTGGLEKYTPSESHVSYLASGLEKNGTFLDPPVYSQGQAIYNLKATIAWTNLKLFATTTLVAPPKRMLTEANLRILADTTTSVTDTAQATSIETCIKAEGSENCPTCEEMCAANNGDAPTMCSCKQVPCDNPAECFSQIILASIMLVMLLMF